jgi:serine/threonine protein kinase
MAWGMEATSIGDFDLGQVVGRGGFGVVHRARYRATGREVALKIIDKERMNAAGMTARVVNEVSLHSTLSHPAVVELLGFFEDQHSVYLVMELCGRGDLYKYLKKHGPMAEEEAADLISQVGVALTL